MSDLQYIEAYKQESFGQYSSLGIKICISAGRDLTKEESSAINRAAESIHNAIMATTISNHPDTIQRAALTRQHIIELFPQPIFVEEIPNGYCSDYCCRSLPWFVVTANVGRIKIGWRKRVIEIDWSDSTVTAKAEDLFKGEDVTKNDRMIHAWGYNKAGEYIKRILSAKDDTR